MQAMRPDARVQFPQNVAPLDEAFARAAISLANAFAKGDASALGGMLAPDAKRTLDLLTASGQWEEEVSTIEAVRIVNLAEIPGGDLPSTGGRVFLAIQRPGAAYIVAFAGESAGGTWLFDGAPATAAVRKRASEWDGTSIDDLTAGSGVLASAPPADAPTGDVDAAMNAALGGQADEMMVFGFASLDLMRRIESASGSTASPEQKKAIEAALGQLPPGSLDQLRTMAKAKIDAGYVLPNDKIVMLVNTGEAFSTTLGGKVTRDQVIQFVSNILGMPETQVRAALGGGSPEPATPRPGRGVAPAGG